MTRRRKSSIDKDADIVDAQLEILRAREADFQKILDDMQRLKDSVSLERRELEAKRKELHRERQLINWLPAELLIHIFLTFTDDADSDTSYDPPEVYHRAPVIISHVSSSWRSISLATSQMWSRISVQNVAWNARPIVAFLARSGSAPLDIIFICPEVIPSEVDSYRAERLLTHLSHDIRRIRSIAFRSRAMAMQRLIGVLTLPENEFSSLRTLELSLLSWGPPSSSSSSLVPAELRGSGTSSNCRLTYLRLAKLPLFNIPRHFLLNLTALELGFPPKKSTTPGYMLRMSQLLKFLACTPKLQELVLANTVPYMDVSLNVDDAVQISDSLQKVDPVALTHLHTLDWTYPFGPDIHYFLSFLDCPALEKLFVGVEELPVPPTNVLLLRGYPASAAAQLFATHRVIALAALRDLSLECQNEETIGSVLRKFAFPVLETLELTHVGGGRHAVLPTLPRLESLFRDPRLPCLTHLTLCRFQISAEPAKAPATALLGYMPALVSLTLDGCGGVGTLLDGLAVARGGGGGVRVCPRLEALALLHCADVDIGALVGIVIARNGNANGNNGAGDLAIGAGAGTKGGALRAIRPMKKLRHQGRGAGEAPSTNIPLSTGMMIAMEAGRPARIAYVRIGDCARISEEDVVSLKALGVADVAWTSGPTEQ